MKLNNRVFSLLAAVLMVLTVFTGCGSNEAPEDDSYSGLVIFEEEDSPAEASPPDETETVTEDTTDDTTPATEESKAATEAVTETIIQTSETTTTAADEEWVDYKFRTKKLLDQHYEKHGIEMGFESAQDYEESACEVANDPTALHKTEAEDGDDVYYIEATNEFVIISTDGYIRTYFLPSRGKAYFDSQ